MGNVEPVETDGREIQELLEQSGEWTQDRIDSIRAGSIRCPPLQ